MTNPNPDEGDLELPLPCDGKLVLRHVCVPAEGYFGDLPLELGCENCRNPSQSFMEAKRQAFVAGSFTLEDLPEQWYVKMAESAQSGDGRCPALDDETQRGSYYFIGKYEISNFQWKAVMDDACPGESTPLTSDDPRPKTGISWFEAVEFTRRYTEWLLSHRPDVLPLFSGERYGYLRLPTETEWEYAARGGHLVTEAHLNLEAFFPLNDRPLSDYALYTAAGAARPPEKLAWIGTKCPNPLGLYDTAGNAAEMVLDPFHFSVNARLHGATGGFIIKGGSYLKREAEIRPGRREEMPYFLADQAFQNADLGFRVVLSGIVTPRHRTEDLEEQWTARIAQNHKAQPELPAVSSPLATDAGRNLLAAIERLMVASQSDTEKTNLAFIKHLVQKSRSGLAQQQGELVKAIVFGALFAAEGVTKYTLRREEVLNELLLLKKLKTQTVPESVLESIENDIAKTEETISAYDATIDYFVQAYIHRIRDVQQYPEDVYDRQLDLIQDELHLAADSDESLKRRLDLFREHMAQYRGPEAGLNPETVLKDIVAMMAS
ncbi:MAG: SUMF1/EgtB/PvdO family nonheme iron enzyme [Desulfobacterales bacterium]|nr:MAG: SUMF1/EgtB/PvdO family nonheme iron enzyme [Desulfobacterales bacterium]